MGRQYGLLFEKMNFKENVSSSATHTFCLLCVANNFFGKDHEAHYRTQIEISRVWWQGLSWSIES